MYLMDTCTFLWYLEDSPRLSEKAREIINSDNDIYLSLTSLWEIAIKKTIHKLELNKSTAELEEICDNYGFMLLPIESKCFDTIQKLPYIHGDPFDRLIIATAIEHDLTLLTDDWNIQKYVDVRHIW